VQTQMVQVPPVSRKAFEGKRDVAFSEAKRVLQNSKGVAWDSENCNIWARDQDIVYDQWPAPGTLVPYGTKVRLFDIRADIPEGLEGRPGNEVVEILRTEHLWLHPDSDYVRIEETGKVAPVTHLWCMHGETKVKAERWPRGETVENGGEAPGLILLEYKTKMPHVIGKPLTVAQKEVLESFLRPDFEDEVLKEDGEVLENDFQGNSCISYKVAEAWCFNEETGQRRQLQGGEELDCATTVYLRVEASGAVFSYESQLGDRGMAF
jgi:hypothetical protein